jgi:nicotinate-nucleotide adenylyltransferase
MNTLGLLFGSFDPIHNGHLQIAKWALENDCKEVWLIAQPTNVYKPVQPEADYAHRLAMIHLAIAELPDISVYESDPEVSASHVVTETMRQLSHAERKLRLIVGDDLGHGVEDWPDYHEIARRSTIMTHPRFDDLSSGTVRERISKGMSLAEEVPPAVAAYIEQYGLYR